MDIGFHPIEGHFVRTDRSCLSTRRKSGQRLIATRIVRRAAYFVNVTSEFHP
jgi:hypothetical protein